MVKVIKGVLLQCDPTVKQVILNLDERDHFIIEDLDETHVFVEASCVEKVKKSLEDLLEENTYKFESQPPNNKD
ncbi:9570_t:CDS:2 [Paraglomus brasilianum]|uniref:General transcription and DNA repair factor IIH subunit TFB5 n=2 Tax=Paraglomus TaxID=144537 RepID=A0A9N8VXL9_9GLOM|nr:8438_t:CDS:2 [Paraglomus occultum]CAG8577884.1 9570_t:CDS:2 [Paraglomus brasilianum]